MRAFAEAGAVGAMADWYAVVALFRPSARAADPPLGHHTEEQGPDRRDTGQLCLAKFLTPENIVGKPKKHDMTKALAEWLVRPTARKSPKSSAA
jgi:uncharacterized membrane-anchored protein YjiN (DUF445 family)